MLVTLNFKENIISCVKHLLLLLAACRFKSIVRINGGIRQQVKRYDRRSSVDGKCNVVLKSKTPKRFRINRFNSSN